MIEEVPMRYAFAIPIQPGQTEACRAMYTELAGPRRAEFEDMQRRTGVTEEAYWLQTTPQGDSVIMTSNSDQRDFLALMADPQTDFDRWFRDRISTIFGFDPAAVAQMGPPPELLMDWRA
jgi:hypothetical protein